MDVYFYILGIVDIKMTHSAQAQEARSVQQAKASRPQQAPRDASERKFMKSKDLHEWHEYPWIVLLQHVHACLHFFWKGTPKKKELDSPSPEGPRSFGDHLSTFFNDEISWLPFPGWLWSKRRSVDEVEGVKNSKRHGSEQRQTSVANLRRVKKSTHHEKATADVQQKRPKHWGANEQDLCSCVLASSPNPRFPTRWHTGWWPAWSSRGWKTIVH